MRPPIQAPKTSVKTAGYFGEVEAVPVAVPGTVPGTVHGTPAGGSTPRRQQISHVEAPPHVTASDVTASVLKRTLISDFYIYCNYPRR
jgi:hypothetical protein